MSEESVYEDFAKTIQSAGVRMGASFDKLGKGLDGLNQKLDKILEILGISVEDKGTDYHILKKDQESAGKEIEVEESGDQEVPSSDDMLRSIDVPNEPMVELLKLEETSVRKSSTLEIAGKLSEPNEYVEIVVSQQISISNDLESLSNKPGKEGGCAKDFKCIITSNLFSRSHDSNDALKLFDELLELDATHVSCLFLRVSNSLSYGPEEKNNETIVAFDPGGNTFTMFDVSYMKLDESSFLSLLGTCSQLWILSCIARITFNWLNQFKELYNGVKINVDKQIVRRLNGVVGVYWTNINLRANFLANVLPGWSITVGVGWNSCSNDTAHKSLGMSSRVAVKYKNSLSSFTIIIDNLDGGASGDDQDTPLGKSSRKKKYHRHTPYQIQELEAAFKENPHPDEKARLELGKRLTLESRQVKFWFKNRRSQMKTQLERHENAILKQENDKLRIENIAMKEAMRSPMCGHCGGQAILGEIHIEEHHLRTENARLRDELNRICVRANKFLGRALGSFPGTMPPGMANSGLELVVGRNGFGAMNSVDTALPMGLDFGNGLSSPLTMMSPRPTPSMSNTDVSFDKSMLMELAFLAMNELLKLAEIGDPLWLRNFDGSGEALNLEEYDRSFPPCTGMKPSNFTTEATKATGTVLINSLTLVETLMDTSRWVEMFSCIVGRTSTIDVISSSSTSGSRNGNLQLIQAEFQVLSALVLVRQVKFLRFCKQHIEGVWAVVDVSIDAIQEGSQPREAGNYRRLPSGDQAHSKWEQSLKEISSVYNHQQLLSSWFNNDLEDKVNFKRDGLS